MQEKSRMRAYPVYGIEFYYFERLLRPFPLHIHNAVLLGALLYGKRQTLVNGKKHILAPGKLLVLPPYTPHGCEAFANEPVNWICMQIKPEILPFITALQDVLYINDKRITELFIAQSNAALEGKLPAMKELSALLQSVCELTCWQAEREESFAAFRQTIANMADRKINLAEMSRISGLDKFELVRKFRGSFGITPYRFHANLRLIHAQEMLARGEEISRCALMCEFYDQSHFSRTFKSHMGITPGIYQKNYLRGQ